MSTERQQGIEKLPSKSLPNMQITMALAEANSFRCAKADRDYLKLFTERLSRENPERVLRALRALGERKRADGESALLDLGTILAEINSKPRIGPRDDNA